MMLDRRGDQVATLLAVGIGRAEDGPVVGFGAAAGEVDLLGLGADGLGDGLPGLLNGLGGRQPQAVDGGRIAVLLGVPGQHGRHHGRVGRSGGRMVQIDHVATPAASGAFVTAGAAGGRLGLAGGRRGHRGAQVYGPVGAHVFAQAAGVAGFGLGEKGRAIVADADGAFGTEMAADAAPLAARRIEHGQLLLGDVTGGGHGVIVYQPGRLGQPGGFRRGWAGP